MNEEEGLLAKFDKEGLLETLNEFYKNYIVDTVHGSFQVFQSFTYGEMVISLLLTAIFLLMVAKWFWEVVR